MNKRLIAVLMAMMLMASLFVGCSPAAEEAPEETPAAEETPAGEETPAAEEPEALPGEDFTLAMITDTGGLGDQSFNDSSWAGLQQAEAEYGADIKVLESNTADDYLPNLTSFAEEEVDIIFGVGFLFEESMMTASEIFPDQYFAIVDAVVDAPNVASLTFAEHEGSFLVGTIAGTATETDVVGFIGGLKFPLIEKFEYGFRAGVKAVNPDAEVLVNYADSFEDAAKGKEIALVQNQSGADIIFHAAGGVGVGLIQAAEEQGFWAIGVDQDQSRLAPDNVLCSMIKRVDVATFTVSEEVINGNFQAGVKVFDLHNDGVGYSDDAGNLTDDLKAVADQYKEMIKAGEFMVPQTADEFEAFEAPAL